MDTEDPPELSLALRAPDGIWWCCVSTEDGTVNRRCLSTPLDAPAPNGVVKHGVRSMQFSVDGSLFAFCDTHATHIIRTSDGVILFRLPITRTAFMVFSPDNRTLVTWEPYVLYGLTNPENKLPEPNQRYWNLTTGELIKADINKRQTDWQPHWTSDGSVCARINGSEILFTTDVTQPKGKFVVANVSAISLSPGRSPYYIAVYIPGEKGQPSIIRLHLVDYASYPSVAHKTFMRCDSVKFEWSPKGNAVLCISSTDVDRSNQSYYGEQQLYLMLTSGEGYKVELEKKGPIYATHWNPNGNQFCVVYGFMPARATIYNMSATAIYDMGEGARNECTYNTQGNLLMICGFGNLSGNMEFWATDEKRLVCKMQVPNTTLCSWAPDGEHIVTATTAPRLRIDNGWRIWHYTGRMVCENMCAQKSDELWEAQWCPNSSLMKLFKPVYLSEHQRITAGLNAAGKSNLTNVLDNGHPVDNMSKNVVNAKGAYVPPHMRGGVIKGKVVNDMLRKPTQTVVKSESEKKQLKLVKKIDEIKDLMRRKEAGDQLETNQLTKIETYAAVVRELEQLKMAA